MPAVIARADGLRSTSFGASHHWDMFDRQAAASASGRHFQDVLEEIAQGGMAVANDSGAFSAARVSRTGMWGWYVISDRAESVCKAR